MIRISLAPRCEFLRCDNAVITSRGCKSKGIRLREYWVGMVWGVWVIVKGSSGNRSGAGHPGGWGGRGCKS